MPPRRFHQVRKFIYLFKKRFPRLKSLSSSTGSFQVLHLLLNEYLLHEVERLVSEEAMRELMINMVNSQVGKRRITNFLLIE